MHLSRADLTAAIADGILDRSQAERLWNFLSGRGTTAARFGITHVLYYLGGLIAIGAMSLFMTLGWERYGGWGIVGICASYAVIGLGATHFLLRRQLLVPAGITATFVLVLVPLAIYGLQSALGWRSVEYAYRDYHRYIDWNWLMMEYATLAAGAVMLWRYRLPFLVMPVAITLWYMSMDLVPFLADGDYDWALRKLISVWMGLAMILLAFWIDIRNRTERDFAFWMYLFGLLMFSGGLSAMNSDSEIGKFTYACIHLLLIAAGAILNRRTFAVFGGLGVAGYLGYLSWHLFRDSFLFPFALSALGFAVVYAGILWQRHERRLSAALRGALPGPVRELVERRA
ncbi:MAG TPA: DUF2157 domain-containing protein [Candidatus Binatia bacterium]|nr:DUF2157 domain-containing protein [Candidatus Binatia bacterium]